MLLFLAGILIIIVSFIIFIISGKLGYIGVILHLVCTGISIACCLFALMLGTELRRGIPEYTDYSEVKELKNVPLYSLKDSLDSEYNNLYIQKEEKEGKTVYYYVVKDGDGYKVKSIDDENVTVKYITDKPHLTIKTMIGKVKELPLIYKLCAICPPGSGEETTKTKDVYVFYVPEGSVSDGFKIDIE